MNAIRVRRRAVLLLVLPLGVVLADPRLLAAESPASGPLPGIVFVSGEILGPEHERDGYLGGYHWRDGYIYPRSATYHALERTITPTRPGRNLYTLIPASPDGRLTRITHLTDGEVFDPEPSYDGRRILFSMRRDGEDWFHLYEIDVDGAGLVQLTDGPFNDVSGVYLPDGRIVFVSDRTGYLEEYHEERTETLWTMAGDGTEIEQLTFNPGTVFDPTVLADGRVLFSLWDAFMIDVPPLDKHETYLMTVRPDGTEETRFFGAGQYRFFNRERHSGVGLTQAGEMPDAAILVQSEMGPSILDPRRGASVTDALWPVFPGTTSVQLGGTTHQVHLSPTGNRSTPYPMGDGRFLMAGTLPGARDMAIYVADPATRETRLVYNDPDRSEYDARPILVRRDRPAVLPAKQLGGWGKAQRAPVIQASGNSPDTASNSSARLGERDRRVEPAGTGHGDPASVTGRARFLVVNGRRAENPEHERALRRARYFRVVEALDTAVTTSSHTNLQTRILGVVPILPDGSAYFEAPADTPLFLEALDAAGNRIHFDWNYPMTSVPVGSKQTLVQMAYMTARSGEVKSCYGCHAPQDEAPPPAPLMALAFGPASVDRELTDITYRRNEPDEYRTAARIGEAPRYRPWLASNDPDLRRRACELLMQIEDGARQDAPVMAALLKDDSVDVRRAAALALSRLGSLNEAEEIVEGLADADWQVRFHCVSALEVITGRAPAGRRHARAARSFYEQLFSDLGGSDGVRRSLVEGDVADESNLEARSRWFEAVGRLGIETPANAREKVREALRQPLPDLPALRAAGWIRDADSVPLLAPWLTRHEQNYHAAEAAIALGRIGTPGAIDALWSAVRSEVPNRKVYISRYLQHGPRPEEYSLLRGLLLAGAPLRFDDAHLVVAMLPGTFLEKPRFEDRMRPESQRVLLGRMLFESGNLRRKSVALLAGVLRGDVDAGDALYQQILAGINLERPFSEHGRPFPVVERIEPEQALWLLGCLAETPDEVPEASIAPFLTSSNWRERIDAAMLLGRLGFGPGTAAILSAEVEKPYEFNEIASIGKGRPDPNFRDKAYLAQALARHVSDVERLSTLADPTTRFRDVRYGLAVGLGLRGRSDGVELLLRLATEDPIALVRRQARESLLAIQEHARLAGESVPEIMLPESLDAAVLYPPRGIAGWAGVPIERPTDTHPKARESDDALTREIAEGLRPEHYRNLNNAQARGAEHMMISGITRFSGSVERLGARQTEAADTMVHQLLDSPYPFAHYLALRHLGVSQSGARQTGRPASEAVPEGAGTTPAIPSGQSSTHIDLIARLHDFAAKADTVGFYWTCEVLARRQVKAAIPQLAKFAQPTNAVGIHGPEGMGLGYPAAKALASLAGDAAHPEVARLLSCGNAWLEAGALAGLTEARAPGIADLLEQKAVSDGSALVRAEARAGLIKLSAAGERASADALDLSAR